MNECGIVIEIIMIEFRVLVFVGFDKVAIFSLLFHFIHFHQFIESVTTLQCREGTQKNGNHKNWIYLVDIHSTKVNQIRSKSNVMLAPCVVGSTVFAFFSLVTRWQSHHKWTFPNLITHCLSQSNRSIVSRKSNDSAMERGREWKLMRIMERRCARSPRHCRPQKSTHMKLEMFIMGAVMRFQELLWQMSIANPINAFMLFNCEHGRCMRVRSNWNWYMHMPPWCEFACHCNWTAAKWVSVHSAMGLNST